MKVHHLIAILQAMDMDAEVMLEKISNNPTYNDTKYPVTEIKMLNNKIIVLK